MGVVGVSRDDQEKNDRFAESLDLQYPLVGDPEGRICSEWGTKIPLLGLSRRISFLVGKEKLIERRHKGNQVEGHIEMVRSAVGVESD